MYKTYDVTYSHLAMTETLKIETKVEYKIALDTTAASRSNKVANMKGPVPIGKAASKTATFAHNGSISKTQNTSIAVTMG